MSTPQDLQAIVANFQTALEASSLKAAANQCLKDIAARDNPTTLAYERPLILDLPKRQPTINVSITINNFGE